MSDTRTPPTTATELLDRAADIIEQRGLAQGDLEGPDGAVCTIGALNVALTGDARTTWELDNPHWMRWKSAADRFIDYLDEHGQFEGEPEYLVESNPIVWWSDSPGRTQAEVVDTLRRAARAGA